jgi:hypothetical protein
MIKQAAVCTVLAFLSSAVIAAMLRLTSPDAAAADVCAQLGSGRERWRASCENRENIRYGKGSVE